MTKSFIFLIFIFLSAISFAQENNTLEDAINKAGSHEKLVGAVWSIFDNDVVTTGAFGLKNADTNEALDSDDKVLIGSVTKTLIATGILRLSSQGKLDLDLPVYKILPKLAFDNPWKESHPVTVRDLLNHTAGIEDSRFWQIFSTRPKATTPLEYVFTKNPSVLKVRTIPGTRFSYSNMGYSYLGLIIEKITQESYEKYLDKNLLIPLGMVNSTFAFVTQNRENTDLAMGHFDDGTTQENIPMYLRPAGQFATTAKDMAQFAKFLMSDGTIKGESFIDEELLSQMGKPPSSESYENGLKSGYQFGLSYRDRYGVIGKFHRGNIIGFRATFYLFPEQNKAFFISFNSDRETANYEKFNSTFIDQLKIAKPQKLKAKDNLSPSLDEFESYYKMNPVRFKMFAYLDLLFNSIKVEKVNNKLIVKSLQNRAYNLLPVGKNLFRKEDRINPSHVLYKNGTKPTISDGLVTYEKISWFYLSVLWLSLLLGLLGIVIILFRGLYLLFCKKLFDGKQCITIPFLSIIGLFITIPFLLNQSFLNLGDFTFANVLLAIATGFLPLAMIFGVRKMWVSKIKIVDVVGILSILQWTVILVYWGLIPFRFWV